eukprot:TRINITY_DN2164_c0_g1_i2.p1 TRINITY_DN2164_c0_g1~~TRINITY_DN2164_c0_g1_i2.p1  ORF type:complete len:487 (+),score=114.68 TRINITY_DN2164_c0_g1_i2:35-1495(+)
MLFWKKLKNKKTKKKETSNSQEEFARKTISDLSAEEVCFWVGSIGFQQYAPKFLENEISGDILLELTENDLLSIGIKNNHHCEMILKEIQKFSIIKNQQILFHNNLPDNDPILWSVEDVSKYMKSIGFQEYIQTFEENLIDGKVLFDLDDKDLIEMGMESTGHRKKLLSHCEIYLQTIKKPKTHGFKSSRIYTSDDEEEPRDETLSKRELLQQYYSSLMNEVHQKSTNPGEWKIADVHMWLQQIGLEQYKEQFNKHQIDGQTLIDIDRVDLESIGVHSIGHQKKLLTEIENLCQNHDIKKDILKGEIFSHHDSFKESHKDSHKDSHGKDHNKDHPIKDHHHHTKEYNTNYFNSDHNKDHNKDLHTKEYNTNYFKMKDKNDHNKNDHNKENTFHKQAISKTDQNGEIPHLKLLKRLSDNDVGSEDDDLIVSYSEIDNSSISECKVCFDLAIDTVLVDCGHTVCCHECGISLRNCPICKKPIIKVVRT